MGIGTNGPASITPTSTNIYFDFGFIGAVTSTLINAQRRLPVAMTVTDLQGELNTALTAGQSAAARLNVNGVGSNTIVLAFGTESAPTAALVATASGNLTNGTYKYKATWVINGYENAPSGASNTVTVDGTHKQIDLTAIAVGPTGTGSRKLYRTIAGGATFLLLTTIADNSTTTYTDNVADGSLGAAQSTSLRVGAAVGSLALAVDDLICYEAVNFVGATSYTLNYLTMPYGTAAGTAIRARSQYASISNPWTSASGTTTGAGSAATGSTGWLSKQVNVDQGTLAADVAPGGATAVTYRIKTNDGMTNTGSAMSISGAATSVRGTLTSTLPLTTSGNAVDNNVANVTQTGSPAAGNVRSAFSYSPASPNAAAAFYSTGRQGFNATIGASAVFPPLEGWNSATAFSGTESAEDIFWPVAGTFKFLGINSNVDSGTTVTFALRVNGVDSALVLTITGTGAVQWVSDLSTTVHVSAGDLVNYKALQTVGSGSTFTVAANIFFLPD